TADFQVVRLDELAHGLVFTHRLTAEEISSNRAVMSPDLASLNVGTIDLSSAGLPVSMDLRPGDATQAVGWVGPAGWLAGFAPGDLVGFRRSGDEVIVERVDEVDEGAAEASALRAAYDTLIGDKEGVGEEAWIVLETALIDDPQLFRSPV